MKKDYFLNLKSKKYNYYMVYIVLLQVIYFYKFGFLFSRCSRINIDYSIFCTFFASLDLRNWSEFPLTITNNLSLQINKFILSKSFPNNHPHLRKRTSSKVFCVNLNCTTDFLKYFLELEPVSLKARQLLHGS